MKKLMDVLPLLLVITRSSVYNIFSYLDVSGPQSIL